MDPDYERWKRRYPKYPGLDVYVDLLRSGKVRGTQIDIICAEIASHASEEQRNCSR